MLSTLIVGVLAVNQTINLQGTVDFNVTDKTLYIQSASMQDGVGGDEQPLPNFLPGYVNTEFNLNLGTVSNTSGLLIIYLDIINTTTTGYDIGVEYSGPETVSVSTTGSIAAGTGDPVSDLSTSSRVSISISATATEIELSDIRIILSEVVEYTGFYFEINEESKTADLTRYSGSEANLRIPAYFDIRESDGAYIEGNSYKVTAISYYMDDAAAIPAFDEAAATLESVIIPETVSSIDNSFVGCTKLKNVVFEGDSQLTTIGGTFIGCTNLESIDIPKGVTNIATRAFNGCTNLKEINYYAENCVEVGDFAFNNVGIDGLGVSVVFEEGVKSIPANLFYTDNNSSDNIVNVTSITISSSVETIGNNAFRDCINLSSIYYNAIAVGDLSSGSRLLPTSAEYNGEGISVIFGAATTKIPAYLFSSAFNIKSVNFEDNSNLESIGNYAFDDCVALTSITIPEKVTSIGDYAIINCISLTELNINATNATFGSGVFMIESYYTGQEAENVTLTFGEGVENIDLPYDTEFSSLKISTLNLPSTLTSVGNGTFDDLVYLTEINYKAKNLGDFFSSPFSSAGASGNGISLNIEEGVEYIPAYLFYESSSSYSPKITEINITSTVLGSIGAYAFGNCGTFSTIEIPSSVTSIGERAFYECNITSITLTEGIISIGEGAFRNCSDLTSITIPSSVTEIGDYAFRYCTVLTNVTIESITAYTAVTSTTSSCGYLLQNATTVRVPVNIVNNYTNSYLNGSSWSRNLSDDGLYYVYTKN